MSQPSSVARRGASPLLVWAALLVIYVVWGSTYLAIRVVVESMPPFLAGGARFTTAGIILAAVLIARSGPRRMRITRAQLAGSAFVGGSLLWLGNGLVSVGEQSVPSGFAALIVGIVPLVVLVLRRISGERVSAGGIGGVLFGFAGLGVLIIPRGIEGTTDLLGMVLLVVASTSWSIGSFMSSRLRLPRDPLVSTSYQLLLGGLMMLGMGLVLGEWSQVQTGAFTQGSVLALAYLVTFGSLLAYTAYTWLLQNAPIGRVATYAYVNPVVAVALGTFFLHESLDPLMLIGAAMIVSSVALIVGTESRSAVREVAVDSAPIHPRR